MYDILITSAFPKELSIIKKQIKRNNIPNLNISFLQTWVWNYNTIFTLTKELKQKNYDFIVNIGVSWLRIVTDKKQSIWISKNSIFPFYQVANILELETWKELIVPVFFKFWKLATCISANKPIKDIYLNEIKYKFGITDINNEKNLSNISTAFSNFFILDMESYGIEFVSDKFNIPRIILKIPIDKSEKELINFNYKKALEILEKNLNYKELLQQIKEYLDKNKKNYNNSNLEKYYRTLHFSQRQKEIFNFLYKKYCFVVGNNFDSFFYSFIDQNKNLKDKKIITKNLLKNMEDLINKNI